MNFDQYTIAMVVQVYFVRVFVFFFEFLYSSLVFRSHIYAAINAIKN